uniref:Glycine receptor subunit alpha-3-like n=1 Tax=Saccoglossus kowalevskii TaxID=10224 RepID=A0ABM0MZP8_SACKO|nr:PREDICTED: glycine receptor subunit alpha-3-like [Saccoglossus kowalevskii]
MTGDARGTAFFLFLVYAVAQCYNSVEESTKIDHTELLAALLADHDIRIRPNVHGRDYSITTYFRQHWNDPRLQFNATGFINMNGNIMDAIWVPDLYFENAKDTAVHTTTKDNLFLRIYPNGDVFYSVRLGLKLTCHMHLSRFPMDRQQCKIEVETYSYTTTDMKLQWFDTSPLQIDPEGTTRIFAKIKLKRELGFYILQAYVPSILLVILSWFSLWMEPSAAPARVALGITTVLALVTQGTWMRSQLPKVAYATDRDTCDTHA